MKTIRLFFDMEFTSLSPDAQIISLGIVSESKPSVGSKIPFYILPVEIKSKFVHFEPDWFTVESIPNESIFCLEFKIPFEYQTYYNNARTGRIYTNLSFEESKSFYAEFSDFNIERCDDWVKENVVSKLKFWNDPEMEDIKLNFDFRCGLPPKDEGFRDGSLESFGSTKGVSINLNSWLAQFSDYQIEFVGDCCTYDWFHLLQLIGEWDEIPSSFKLDVKYIPDNFNLEEFLSVWNKHNIQITDIHAIPHDAIEVIEKRKIGLPKLPSNITPVPFDLNDFIAIKKGISVKEAFDLDREMLGLGFFDHEVSETMYKIGSDSNKICENKHNSLWDAKVIKSIYEKLC